jgi:hypothetical protein
VNRHSYYSTVLTLVLGSVLVLATAAHAQPPAPAPPSDPTVSPPPPADDDDDAKLRPAEPDFSVVNIPTTLPLPVHGGDFHLTHRFGGNLRAGTFGDNLGNLFGLDQGAAVGLEYRFGVIKHLEAIVMRTNIDKAIQFSGKYDAIHQSASHPFGFSAIVAVQGSNNFRIRYVPTIGASISRTFDEKLALYATPMWVHNSAADSGIDRDTGWLGLGARYRFLSSSYLVFEVSPRLGGYVVGDPEFAFGFEKRIGGHVFDLTFANTLSTTYEQLSHGGAPSSLYLGFNLTRKFF